jgi:acyl carrier protein
MEWKEFEENVRETLEIEDDVTINKDDVLENTEYWSSMHALLIMALAESEYDISLTGEELRNSKTLSDLFELFQSKSS